MGKTKERDYFFDNAKFVLIFLVVFGHALEYFTRDNSFNRAIYSLIYFIHMPVFIMISGYFSKDMDKKGYFKKLFIKVLVPYIVFQFLYTLFNNSVLGGTIELDFFNPYWIMWFMLSLFGWNVLLYFFKKIQMPIVVAVAIALISGYFSSINADYTLARMISFFPFFVIGHYMNKDMFSSMQTKAVRIAAGIYVPLLFMSLYLLGEKFSYGWLWMSYPYEFFGVGGTQAAMTKLIIYGLIMLSSCAFLSFIPNKKTFFSKMGGYSIYAYLLHGFVVRWAIGQEKMFEVQSGLDVIWLGGMAFVLTMLLMSPPVIFLLKIIVEPYKVFESVKKIFKSKNRI